MTDKVQKIREEVERRLWLLVPKMTFQHQRKELENILSFIDSMQEEPVSKVANDVTKNKESAINFLKSAGIVDENNQLAKPYRQEPVSEDLEDAANSFIAPYHEVSECGENWGIHPKEAFKAGANWQREKAYKFIDDHVVFKVEEFKKAMEE